MFKYWAARHWAAHGTGPHGTGPHGTGPKFFRDGAASGPSCHTPPCYLLWGTAALAPAGWQWYPAGYSQVLTTGNGLTILLVVTIL